MSLTVPRVPSASLLHPDSHPAPLPPEEKWGGKEERTNAAIAEDGKTPQVSPVGDLPESHSFPEFRDNHVKCWSLLDPQNMLSLSP